VRVDRAGAKYRDTSDAGVSPAFGILGTSPKQDWFNVSTSERAQATDTAVAAAQDVDRTARGRAG
jgi:hypothetical protein